MLDALRSSLLAAALLVCAGASAQSVSVGGGPIGSLELGTPGINLRTYYNHGEHVCGGIEASVFLPSRHHTLVDAEVTEYLSEINLNIHYVFELTHHLGWYPVVGFNATRIRETVTGPWLTEADVHIVQAAGANLGGGLHGKFKRWSPYLEYKYVAGELADHFIAAGVVFTFSKREPDGSHESH